MPLLSASLDERKIVSSGRSQRFSISLCFPFIIIFLFFFDLYKSLQLNQYSLNNPISINIPVIYLQCLQRTTLEQGLAFQLVVSFLLLLLLSRSLLRMTYKGHLESKERFAIKKYLLTIGKKKKIFRFYHTPSPTSPHSHLGH